MLSFLNRLLEISEGESSKETKIIKVIIISQNVYFKLFFRKKIAWK